MSAAAIFQSECECAGETARKHESGRGVDHAAPERAPATRFTLIVTLAAPPEQVWRELADVEALPRWAGSFCERVELTRGGWVAWTSLGELVVDVEACERAGESAREVTLRLGWTRDALHAFTLRIAAAGDGGARVTLAETGEGSEDRARLAHALREALPGLLASTERAIGAGMEK